MWDLGDLDAAPIDAAMLASVAARARDMTDAVSVAKLAAILGDLEQLGQAAFRLSAAAFLRHAVEVGDPQLTAGVQRAQEQVASLWSVWLDLNQRWRAVDPARRVELASDPALVRYQRLLESPPDAGDVLSDAEERILAQKALTGVTAWQRLFATLIDDLRVRLDSDGPERELSLEEALGLLEGEDRPLRRRSADAISRALEPGIGTRAFILNTVLLDRIVDDRLRNRGDWLAHASEANGVPVDTTRALLDAVTAANETCRRFYRLKARLMGCDRLPFDADRLAPVGGGAQVIPWEVARALVIDGTEWFSPAMASAGRQAFDRGWIDARPHPHKLPHAMTTMVPGGHPYILLSYTGSLRSFLTLAHELGAAVHHALSADRPLFESYVPMVVSEAVSLLSEQIVLHHAIDVETDPHHRLALLMTLLDSEANMVFRHVMMTRFEMAVRDARETQGELAAAVISGLWMDEHRAMLGDDAELPGQFSGWWSYVPHLISAPGHEHLHATACLAARSIFRRWAAGELPADAVVAMLRAGGSSPPSELFRSVGIDLDDASLWERELAALERAVAEAERLADEVVVPRG